MFWVCLVVTFHILIVFLLGHVNLILFCMHDYFHLPDVVSKTEVNLVFNNDAQKVIKDAFKHARCISVAI
jgi:hypothetical protein